MKKLYINDFLLIAVIIFLLFVASLFIYKSDSSSNITVMYNNEYYNSYSLDTDITEAISDSGVVIEIRNGNAAIVVSDCPDKVCLRSKSIGKEDNNGASIVCLPNKVAVIKEKSTKNKEVDAVAG